MNRVFRSSLRSLSFSPYLCSKLVPDIDAGVLSIHCRTCIVDQWQDTFNHTLYTDNDSVLYKKILHLLLDALGLPEDAVTLRIVQQERRPEDALLYQFLSELPKYYTFSLDPMTNTITCVNLCNSICVDDIEKTKDIWQELYMESVLLAGVYRVLVSSATIISGYPFLPVNQSDEESVSDDEESDSEPDLPAHIYQSIPHSIALKMMELCKLKGENTNCGVCLEPVTQKTVIMPSCCGQLYCIACLDRCKTCPTCRNPLSARI